MNDIILIQHIVYNKLFIRVHKSEMDFGFQNFLRGNVANVAFPGANPKHTIGIQEQKYDRLIKKVDKYCFN